MARRRLSDDTPFVVADATPPATLGCHPSGHQLPVLNSHFPWDDFDSSWYLDHNYKKLRDDDRQIIEIVRDFFVTFGLPNHRYEHGIDVGAGTNLYPALTMLPLCDKITLYEYAASNFSWLQHEIHSYSPSWDPFWDLLANEPTYKLVDSPREVLATTARVEKGSVFDLPELRWDIGTMFFVAESISFELSEFQAALRSFLRSLRPGAPFAAAFMEGSLGYDVSAHRFPAVAITADDVKTYLTGDTEDLKVHRIGTTSNPLRDGYEGMILATGRVSSTIMFQDPVMNVQDPVMFMIADDN
ncbi:MAG: SCO2525 family SAM-dependent methyltransferase [Actinomycetota bacterium]|nr:SCO2525 family SAM-dependent methyltransferase [Actinomycetota bacterium]